MPRIPTSVQFELTYRCNNYCNFCYNTFSGIQKPEASTAEVKLALCGLAEAGVFSVNFNGGEPLLRKDFFEISDYALSVGLDIHLNTNCTTVDDEVARQLSCRFPAVCTTVLSSDPHIHDALSGRSGALAETERGILALRANNVYVAVNITLTKANASHIDQTLSYLHGLGVRSALITSVVESASITNSLSLSEHDLEIALRAAIKFQKGPCSFQRMAFPQPYPLCRFGQDIRADIGRYNIPCTLGLNTLRIAPNGVVSPCTLVSKPLLGNIVQSPFPEIWKRFIGESTFKSHLPCSSCHSCPDLEYCGGGCVGTNSTVGIQP